MCREKVLEKVWPNHPLYEKVTGSLDKRKIKSKKWALDRTSNSLLCDPKAKDKEVPVTEHLQWVKHSSDAFTYVLMESFEAPCRVSGTVLCIFHRWEYWGAGRLNKLIQLVSRQSLSPNVRSLKFDTLSSNHTAYILCCSLIRISIKKTSSTTLHLYC